MVTTTVNLTRLDGNNGFRLDGEKSDFSGGSVSNAGDVNGDGFDDVIVGARSADQNGAESGTSYVIFGKASGFKATMDLPSLNGRNGFRLNGTSKYENLGYSVSTAGDVNGDGFDDLIIGAPGQSDSIYVVFGKASGFDATLDLLNPGSASGFRINGITQSTNMRISVSNAGDVNGDGFDDLIIGAPGDFFFFSDEPISLGTSYVIFGKGSGFDATMNLSELNGNNGFRLNGVVTGGYLGWSVSNAGDINGDGFDDLIVGAPYADLNGIHNVGTSYVVFGKSSGFDASLDLSNLDGSNGFRLDGKTGGDKSGRSISNAGDINGDGFDDVIVGSYVVFGKDSGFNATMSLSTLDGSNGFRLGGESERDQAGRSVSNAGDVNGDGFDDIIVGGAHTNPNGTWSGTSYVIFGKNSGFDATVDLSNLGSGGFRLLDGTASFGLSVSGAGDINDDNFDDLIVGNPNPTGDWSGTSYVIFGRSDFNSGKVIEGTPGDDILVGGDGDDNLSGNDGSDTIDGGIGNDVLTGGLGNDILMTGFGEDQLSGNEGDDLFSFYATGYFTVQDFDKSSDLVTFNPETTGINDINDLLRVILSIEDNNEGVMVHFEEKVASINFIGLHSSDLTVNMVDFS